MSSHAAVRPRPMVRALGAALGAEAAAQIVVVLGVVALAVLTWMAWGDLTHDTGYDWLAAQRMASHGELPYEDFTYWYGPLGVAVLDLFYEIFGTGIGTVVMIGLAVTAAILCLSYLLARRLTGPPGAAIVALLSASAAFGAGNMNDVLPHAQVAPLAVALCLGALLAAASAAQRPTRLSLEIAGACAGLVALTRPEFLVAIVVALGAWLTLRVMRAAPGERGAPVRDAVRAGAVALAIPVIAYGLIFIRVSPHELVRENLYPSALLHAGGNHVLKAAAPMTAGSFAKLAAHLALYAAGCAALVGAGAIARRGSAARRAVLAGAGLAAIVFAGVLAAKHEAVRSHLHFALDWIPAGAGVASLWLVWRARPRAGREWPVRDQVALLVSAFLTVIAAKTYGAFRPEPNAINAQYAIYAMPFAALFLVWLHGEALPRGNDVVRAIGLGWVGALCVACLVLVAIDGRHETATIHAARGTLRVPATQQPAYQGAIAAIQGSTKRHEKIFLAPQLSALAALTERDQATIPVALLPGAIPDGAQETWAISHLGDVRLAITDRRPLTEYGQGAFGITFDRGLGAWLRRDFRHVATLRGSGANPVVLDVWTRRSTA